MQGGFERTEPVVGITGRHRQVGAERQGLAFSAKGGERQSAEMRVTEPSNFKGECELNSLWKRGAPCFGSSLWLPKRCHWRRVFSFLSRKNSRTGHEEAIKSLFGKKSIAKGNSTPTGVGHLQTQRESHRGNNREPFVCKVR